MFYLTTHSTHFIYGYKEGGKWGVFNDAHNTFNLRLYGIRHRVKDHSDSERGNPLPAHGLFFPISSKGFFYMHHSTDRIAHTTDCGTAVVEHLAGTRNSSMGTPWKIDPTTQRTMSERSYHGATNSGNNKSQHSFRETSTIHTLLC